MNIPEWYRDENLPTGVDYTDITQVEVYDRRHQRFRDYGAFANHVIEAAGIQPDHTLIDLGAGTGAFVLQAASRCRMIYAVDVSKTMLAFLRQKADLRGIDNVVYCHGGFLTYDHTTAPVDAVISSAALHHLPDFWKLVGLRRVAQMLKPGGRLYLMDVIFSFKPEELHEQVEGWIDGFVKTVGEEFREEVVTHVRDEFSTFDWVMEGFLERAGFRIDSITASDTFTSTYLCTKV
ncbi:MAG: methyltransferase domain-containing protein [Anaerolineae bacterium]|nr:methyltransferase domain-containing protein [Anaerolineae bacterium]